MNSYKKQTYFATELLAGQIKNISYFSVFKHKIGKWNSEKRH